jgi:hypothetical protein
MILGICWGTSLVFLYLTYSADPGVILPSLTKGSSQCDEYSAIAAASAFGTILY